MCLLVAWSSPTSRYENRRTILCHFHRIFSLEGVGTPKLNSWQVPQPPARLSSRALSSQAAWAPKKIPRLEHSDGKKKKVSTQTQKSSVSLNEQDWKPESGLPRWEEIHEKSATCSSLRPSPPGPSPEKTFSDLRVPRAGFLLPDAEFLCRRIPGGRAAAPGALLLHVAQLRTSE